MAIRKYRRKWGALDSPVRPSNPLSAAARRVCGRSTSALAVFVYLVIGVPGQAWLDAGQIPSENPGGLLYSVTHLHAAAYVVLFLIFLLSMANLFLQYGADVFWRPFTSLLGLVRKSADEVSDRPVLKGLQEGRLSRGASGRRKSRYYPAQHHVEGSEAVAPVRKLADHVSAKPPTPMDGINHPLPPLSPQPKQTAGTPRLGKGTPDARSAADFKFSCAVDVPTRQEVERREKTSLLVSGAVLGPDGKGISSVIVYLADADGNRVGQSCRSMPDTGEFKVLVNEPGKYVVKGYKRGLIMESQDALWVPIESGKVEGFNFRMVPEGCLVKGQLVSSSSGEALSGYEVRCTCPKREYARSARTDGNGSFGIHGVPVNSECYLEVLDGHGAVLMRSTRFQTVQKKEHHVDIRLSELLDPVIAEPAHRTDHGQTESSDPESAPSPSPSHPSSGP